MKFNVKIHRRNISEQELIADVVAVSKKIRRNTVTIQNYLEHGKYGPGILRRRFKSWLVVLEKAGLKPSRTPVGVEEEQLLENIQHVWAKLGAQPYFHQMRAPLSRYSQSTYSRRFGTWGNALWKFVEYQNSKKPGSGKVQNKKRILPGNKNKKSKRGVRTSRTIPHSLRHSVFIRDGLRCAICGRSTITHKDVALQCDHIRPWSKGGETVMDNLQTLCYDCNIGKGNKSIMIK